MNKHITKITPILKTNTANRTGNKPDNASEREDQELPKTYPKETSSVLHIKDPVKENTINFLMSIFAIPAGILIISRMPGASLPNKTA